MHPMLSRFGLDGSRSISLFGECSAARRRQYPPPPPNTQVLHKQAPRKTFATSCDDPTPQDGKNMDSRPAFVVAYDVARSCGAVYMMRP